MRTRSGVHNTLNGATLRRVSEQRGITTYGVPRYAILQDVLAGCTLPSVIRVNGSPCDTEPTFRSENVEEATFSHPGLEQSQGRIRVVILP